VLAASQRERTAPEESPEIIAGLLITFSRNISRS
jgi:hypothetical protein